MTLKWKEVKYNLDTVAIELADELSIRHKENQRIQNNSWVIKINK